MKRNGVLIHVHHRWILKISFKVKKANVKNHVLYDTVYIKCPEEAKS